MRAKAIAKWTNTGVQNQEVSRQVEISKYEGNEAAVPFQLRPLFALTVVAECLLIFYSYIGEVEEVIALDWSLILIIPLGMHWSCKQYQLRFQRKSTATKWNTTGVVFTYLHRATGT